MTVEDQTGVLQVDKWEDRAGIEILVGLRMVLRRKCGLASLKVSLEYFQGCRADRGASQRPDQLTYRPNDMYSGQEWSGLLAFRHNATF